MKRPVKLRERLEANLELGFADPKFRTLQEILGFLDPQPCDVFIEVQARAWTVMPAMTGWKPRHASVPEFQRNARAPGSILTHKLPNASHSR
jgi:hypothetical protein